MQTVALPAFDAVIFDFDGTLIASFPAIVRAWNAAFQPILGREVEPTEVISHFGVPDIPMVLGAMPEGVSEPEKQNALDRYFAAYAAAHAEIEVFAGVPELLRGLQKIGMPLGLMTGKGRRATDITLAHLGWNFFGAVLTGDEVENQKPHPEGPLRVAEALGVAPEKCAFVGDSPADIGAAESAGMFAVVAGWHDYYHEKLRRMQPDLWPESPLELRAFFLGQ